MGTKPMKHTGTLFLFLVWLLFTGRGGSSSPGNMAVTRSQWLSNPCTLSQRPVFLRTRPAMASSAGACNRPLRRS